jgi:ubiquinone/menaquinone biosynthesis C-methylase UbiE
MDNVCAPIAADVVAAIGPPPFSHLLDVGGASGTWTIAFLQARPEATATIFDLPHVIPMAEQRIRAAGFAKRVRLVAGDFERDALPAGADLAWISAIIHQNSREQNRRLYSAVAFVLAPAGRVLIRDMIMKPSRTEPAVGALFAVNMLVGTPAGGTYTLEEIREDLDAAGFDQVQVLRSTEGMDSVIGAKKKSK